jgi:hypothetical protein
MHAPWGTIRSGALLARSLANRLTRACSEAAIRERDLGAQGHDEWCEAFVTPEVQRMRLESVAWEDLIAEIKAFDAEHGRDLGEFYAQCLKYNGLGATVGPSCSAAAHATE